MAKITCGVNAADNESFNGMTIAQVMEQYGQFLNIPQNNLVILVNDEEEDDTSYVIQSSDEVEFVKTAGEKGWRKQSRKPKKKDRNDYGYPMSMQDIRKEKVKRRNCRSLFRR
jgi:hypothetical protein